MANGRRGRNYRNENGQRGMLIKKETNNKEWEMRNEEWGIENLI